MDRKRVAIVGLGGYHPELPKGMHVWTVNSGIRKSTTLHFYLHSESSMVEYEDMAKAANERNIPVAIPHTIAPMPDINPELQICFPIKEIAEKFQIDYFTSSLAYMIAYALFMGFDEINLYGFMFSTSIEYFEQKACGEFWIGMARGMGVDVKIHDHGSVLLKQPDDDLYGYEKTIDKIK